MTRTHVTLDSAALAAYRAAIVAVERSDHTTEPPFNRTSLSRVTALLGLQRALTRLVGSIEEVSDG
jgi:hypothetical protein